METSANNLLDEQKATGMEHQEETHPAPLEDEHAHKRFTISRLLRRHKDKGGQEDAEEGREDIQENQQGIDEHNGLDKQDANAQEKHNKIQSKKQTADDNAAEVHADKMVETKEPQNQIAVATLHEVKPHNTLDEKDEHAHTNDKVTFEHQNASDFEASKHSSNLKDSENLLDDINDANAQGIKAKNAIDIREGHAQDKQVKILAEHQNIKESDAKTHQRGLKTADHRREIVTEATLEELKAHNGLDQKGTNTLKKHDDVLAKHSDSEKQTFIAHQRDPDKAEERRATISKATLEKIKAHNALDEKRERALTKRDKTRSEHQKTVEGNADAHQSGSDAADEGRENTSDAILEEIKAHNAPHKKREHAIEKHDEVLTEHQKNVERSAKVHQSGSEATDQRREEIGGATREATRYKNAIQVRQERTQQKLLEVTSEYEIATKRDAEIHQNGLEAANERRENNSEATLEEIKAHNALDEKGEQTVKKHGEVLSEDQKLLERHGKAHESGREAANQRREEIADATRVATKSNNAIPERQERAQHKLLEGTSEHEIAIKRDAEIHQSGLEAADERRENISEAILEEIKAHNALDEKGERTMKKHGEVLSENQKFLERHAEAHQNGRAAADQRREEIAQATREVTKAKNAIQERQERARQKLHEVTYEHEKAIERDAEIHQSRLETAIERRENISEATLEEIKAHNALDQKGKRAKEKHDYVLTEHQKTLERSAKAHQSGREAADERREGTADATREETKAKNALGERQDRAQTKLLEVTSEHEKATERDAEIHQTATGAAGKRRKQIAETTLEDIKVHNALEEKAQRATTKHDRIDHHQNRQRSLEALAHDHGIHEADKRRESISEDNAEHVKASNRIEDLDRAAAHRRRSLAAASQRRLQEDVARTSERLVRAEKVKAETTKSRKEAAKKSLESLDDTKKRHDDLLKEREVHALQHFAASEVRPSLKRDSAISIQ